MKAALAAALCVAATAAGGEALPEPRVVRVGEGVHVLLGPIQHANPGNQGYMINSTVIVGDRGVILVDSGGSLEVGRHIAAAVRRITDKPVTHVVNTHHHGDHYLGNGAFDAAQILSSEAGARLVRETGGEWLAIMERDIGHALPGTQPIAASSTYPASSRTETRIHGMRIVFWVPQGSHTPGDLMVYLPDERVLIAGDILVNGVVPTLQDGFLSAWIATLDEIAAIGAVRFVPGHGDPMQLHDVIALRGALDRLRAGVRDGYRRGLDEAGIRRSLDLAAWEKLERSYVIGRNINRAWLEIEGESFAEAVPPVPRDEALWRSLAKEPNLVVLMRHTEPAGGDPLAWDESGNCVRESMLTEAGKAHAKRIGKAFERHGIKPAVVSSPMCRCRDTARIAFGVAPATDGELREAATADASRMAAFERTAQSMIAARRGAAPVVFVSHRPNIDRLTMELIESGELLVGRASPRGEIDVLGRIRIP